MLCNTLQYPHLMCSAIDAAMRMVVVAMGILSFMLPMICMVEAEVTSVCGLNNAVLMDGSVVLML